MQRKLTGLGPFFVFLAASVVARADDAASVAELPQGVAPGEDIEALDLEKLLDAEVGAATKTQVRTADAPSIVSIVPRKQIDDYAWLSLNDILYKQPGFAPDQDYERRTVSFRGQWEPWNNNHLLLLIDGVPYNDNETGGAFTWEITPLFFAKSVEVVRGPGSALYGSSAVNGVLQINTISAADMGGSFVEGRVRLGLPFTQTYDVFGGASTPLADFTLGFNLFGTEGFEYDDHDGSGRVDDSGSLARFPVRDSRRSSYFFGKVQGAGALRDLSLQVHNQAWQYETNRGWLFFAPDLPEKMEESRQLITLRYAPIALDVLKNELVVQWQRHNIHHTMRFYPNDAFDGYYPAGLTEVVETHFDSLFARAQTTWEMGEGASLLAGTEYTGFFYFGDDAHYANVDLTNADGGYPPFDGPRPLGSYYEWIEDRPVTNIGVYTQLSSGRVLYDLIAVTLGLRYDGQFFTYHDIGQPAQPGGAHPQAFKSFQQLSPRIGLVAFPTEGLTLKALVGRAFRAPAPLELFGANSFAIASNLYELQPETLSTYELGADWRVLDGLNARANAYFLDLENQIAYGSLNVLDNVYSHRIAGAELELLYGTALPLGFEVDGFVNYSYAHLVSETVQDQNIAPSAAITWVPAHTSKAGVRSRWRALSGSLQGMVFGPTARRSSDRANDAYAAARPAVLDPYFTIDARIGYAPFDWLELSIFGRNLLDDVLPYARGRIARPGDLPFDYRVDGRQVFAQVEVKL